MFHLNLLNNVAIAEELDARSRYSLGESDLKGSSNRDSWIVGGENYIGKRGHKQPRRLPFTPLRVFRVSGKKKCRY